MKTQIVTIMLLLITVFSNAQRIYTIADYPQISYLNGAVATDIAGNIYIPDYNNNRIVKIDALTGIFITVAGTGTGGYNGDNIAATSAQLYGPMAVALDAAGNIYITDYSNNRIRKVNLSTGLISTVAGTGVYGYNGDNITATTAKITESTGIAIDNSGNIYFTDLGNSRIRKIDISTGLIHNIAGTGSQGYNGDGILAVTAQLNLPYGIAVDNTGNVFVADNENNRIRKIDAISGFIYTVAGTGTGAYNNDGIPASSANIYHPISVSLDNSGNLFIADSWNNRIRKVNTSGTISTVAGNGTSGFSGDGGFALSAQMSTPRGVNIDACGNIYISDYYNRKLRKVTSYDVSVLSTDALCPATCNGTVNAFASGGIEPYSFLWNGGIDTGAYHTNVCAGNYTVTITDGAGCVENLSASISQPDSFVVSISSVNATCQGNGSASATVYGGMPPYTYQWSNGLSTSTAGGLSSGNYSLTVTDINNCTIYKSVSIINSPVPFPSVPICLVSVDSISQHNIIIWDKTSFSNVDSFIVCREIATNNYQPIARIPYDSISLFIDTVRTLYFPNTGNPNSGSFRYKIQMQDSCGNLSQFSLYHNTIYIMNNGSGIFYWTQPYSIENGSNPVSSYVLMRDNLGNGNWQAVSSVAGSQQTVSDPLYVIYQNTASWRVKTEWNVICTPTFKNIMSFTSSFSNISTNLTTSSQLSSFERPISVFPNPAKENIDVYSLNKKIQNLKIYNILGKLIPVNYYDIDETSIHVDLKGILQGVYFINIITSEGTTIRKIIKE